MFNPLRREEDAFRLVLYAIGYFAVIVAAALVHSGLGLVVFVLLTAAIVFRVVRSRRRAGAERSAAR